MLPYTIFEDTFIKWVFPTGNLLGYNLLSRDYKVTVATIVTNVSIFIVFTQTLASMTMSDAEMTLLCLNEWIIPTQVIQGKKERRQNSHEHCSNESFGREGVFGLNH